MKKLSEYRGTEAIDLLCELLDPFVEIAKDEKVRQMILDKKPAPVWIVAALRSHKAAFVKVAAILAGVPEDEVNLLTLPRLAIQILTDNEFLELFRSAAQMGAVTSSVSRSESAPVAD